MVNKLKNWLIHSYVAYKILIKISLIQLSSYYKRRGGGVW